MIKNFLSIAFVVLFVQRSVAQSDTSSYSTQRVKINTLLAARSLKFGQYDESLKQRSGIFGLQTKKDLRNSNDILRDVVLNDNQILKEIKVLMEYKDLQNEQKIVQADQNSDRMKGYVLTIKKLQDKQKELKAELEVKKPPANGFLTAIIGLILGCVTAFGVLKFRTNKKADS